MNEFKCTPEFTDGQSADMPTPLQTGDNDLLPISDSTAAPDSVPDITAPAERGTGEITEAVSDIGHVAATDVTFERSEGTSDQDADTLAAEGPRLPFDTQRATSLIDTYRPTGDVTFGWDARHSYLHLQFRRSETPPAEAYDQDIGGHGVTARTPELLEQSLPGITEELMREPGKIVILGSGLSTAPLDILEQRGPDNQPEQTVLLDAIDYPTLKIDLDGLRDVFDQHFIEQPPSLNMYREKCDTILTAAAEGKITLVQHVVGSGEMPDEARNAALVVNVFGPPEHTLREQLDALDPDGRLYASGFLAPEEVVSGIEVTENILSGHMIRKRPGA